ncbi:ATP-dependent RNA helicase ddx42, partial [Quaeritorhiza haematococci]
MNLNSKKKSGTGSRFSFGFTAPKLGNSSSLPSSSSASAESSKKPPKPIWSNEDDDDDSSLDQGPKRKLVKLDYSDDTATTKANVGRDDAQKGSSTVGVFGDDDDNDGPLDGRRVPAPSWARSGVKGFVPASVTATKPATNAFEQALQTFASSAPTSTSSASAPTSTPSSSEATTTGAGDEDDDDPLDAFMAHINEEAKKPIDKPKSAVVRRDDFEEEDNVESYINHMKKKGIEVGNSTAADLAKSEDIDSDEEVYATARAVDAALQQQEEMELALGADIGKRKDIEPLPSVDHSTIDYLEIEKCFYEEHPDIAALTEYDVRRVRSEFGMTVTGHDVAKPCVSFAHFGFDEELMDAIVKQGYSVPTGIQQQAVPVALCGRDIIGIAKTGSGKTAAFLWPMLVHIMDQPELEKGDGPIGLILAPTRELAHQIYVEAKRFAKCYNLNVTVVYGGASKTEQFKALRGSSPEILVATPGRLIDMVKMKATNLRRVSYLVLDEADRMFDLGFEPQVRSFCTNTRPDRQTLLFSATFRKRIERLARDVLTDPVRIVIGGIGQANTDVTQIVHVLNEDADKWDWLVSRLVGFAMDGSVIVFVSKKAGVDELSANLRDRNFSCAPLHGDMVQSERDKVISDFKHGRVGILICTDVAARGLDIKSVKTVVNYDIARDIDSHTHRIGRTGRAGEKGTAYTLITMKEDKFAGELVRNLEDASQAVPHELLDLAMQNP